VHVATRHGNLIAVGVNLFAGLYGHCNHNSLIALGRPGYRLSQVAHFTLLFFGINLFCLHLKYNTNGLRCQQLFNLFFTFFSWAIHGPQIRGAKKTAECPGTSYNSAMPGGVPPQICAAQTSPMIIIDKKNIYFVSVLIYITI
jgi:hypothetical protein